MEKHEAMMLYCLAGLVVKETGESVENFLADAEKWADGIIPHKKSKGLELGQEMVLEADILDAVRHLEHAISIMGIDHVGIGTDFDGDGGVPGLRNASEMINLTRFLIKEGYTDEEIEKEAEKEIKKEIEKEKETEENTETEEETE